MRLRGHSSHLGRFWYTATTRCMHRSSLRLLQLAGGRGPALRCPWARWPCTGTAGAYQPTPLPTHQPTPLSVSSSASSPSPDGDPARYMRAAGNDGGLVELTGEEEEGGGDEDEQEEPGLRLAGGAAHEQQERQAGARAAAGTGRRCSCSGKAWCRSSARRGCSRRSCGS